MAIAHESAGPKLDIICKDAPQPLGYLARDTDGFVGHICHVLDNFDSEPMSALRQRAREHVQQFTDDAFARQFTQVFGDFLLKHSPAGKAKAA